MIEPQTTVLIVLAAGRSTRFGAEDKLSRPWHGLPLGLQIAAATERLPFSQRIAVTSGAELGFRQFGFDIVRNDTPEKGLSRSISLGVAAAVAMPVAAVIIALADMPRITEAHVLRLFALQHGSSTVVASTDGDQARPPALFGSMHFEALQRLEGDQGARDLVRAGRLVEADREELLDIDNEADLRALYDQFGA